MPNLSRRHSTKRVGAPMPPGNFAALTRGADDGCEFTPSLNAGFGVCNPKTEADNATDGASIKEQVAL